MPSEHWPEFVKKLRRHQGDLFTFLEQVGVPFDNNHAERSIRPAVILRKNSYENRSEQGADCQAVLMSVFRTLKQCGHAPIRTVVEAVENYVTTKQLPPLPKPKTTSHDRRWKNAPNAAGKPRDACAHCIQPFPEPALLGTEILA